MAARGRAAGGGGGPMSGAAFGGVYRSRTVEFRRRRPARKMGAMPSPAWDGGEGAEEALLSDGNEGPAMEMGSAKSLPPEWVDDMDQVNEIIAQIKLRMKELTAMHNKHLTQANVFDDGMEEEQEIEIMTSQITAMFHKCQKLIQLLARKGKVDPSVQQKRLAANVASSLAKEVQDLSMTFRKAQSSYLKRMKGREDRNRNLWSADGSLGDESGSSAAVNNSVDDVLDMAAGSVNEGFTDEQIDKLKDNTAVVTQREQEITNIVSSIHELTEIFKDLAQMINDQGSILDQIDYNIEMASHSVEKGRENLEKANTYQKRASKKLLIMLLVVICVGLFFATVFKKKEFDDTDNTTSASRLA